MPSSAFNILFMLQIFHQFFLVVVANCWVLAFLLMQYKNKIVLKNDKSQI